MKIRRRSGTCAGIGLLLFVAHPLVSQELPLAHRWNKGDTHRYLTTIETVINVSGVPGMGEMSVTSTITQTQRYAVQDVAADGSVTLQNTIEAIKLSVASPAGNVVYDSAAPPQTGADPITDTLKVMGQVVGVPITLMVARDGKVQKVSGAAELVAKLKQAMTGMQMMGAGPESMVSDDAKRTEFEQLFSWLPNRAVKPGESWNHEMKVVTPMTSMSSASTYTYRGITTEGGRMLARIESTTVAKPIPGTGSPVAPMAVQLGEGTGTAESFVDPKAARLEKVTARSTQPVTMGAPDGSVSMQGVMKTLYTAQLIAK